GLRGGSARQRRDPPRARDTARSPHWTCERVERDVHALLVTGDEAGAVATTLRFHGAEIFGFLLGVLGGGAPARNAYAAFGEDVRRGLGRFAWRGSLRPGMYALARDELRRHASEPVAAGAQGPVPLPDPTPTVPCRPTDLGAAIAALRGSLPADDRAILILR